MRLRRPAGDVVVGGFVYNTLSRVLDMIGLILNVSIRRPYNNLAWEFTSGSGIFFISDTEGVKLPRTTREVLQL